MPFSVELKNECGTVWQAASIAPNTSSQRILSMAATGMTSGVGRDQFLKLMVAQMKAQDPLEPMNNQEFTSQLAQFSTLEGIEKLNTSFGDMLALQQLTQGAGLLGKAVTYSAENSSAVQTGTVQGFSIDGGQLRLQVDGQAVPIGQIKGMTSAA